MAAFVLIHGAGDGGWYWHLVERELRRRGHVTIAPDLPCEDDEAGVAEYADVVVAAVRTAGLAARADLVVVAQSFGGFTAPLVAARVPTRCLVLVAPMIPLPGEAPAGYTERTRWSDDADPDFGDPVALFYPDVPPALAAEALRRGRGQSEARMDRPLPLAAWPDVPTHVLIGTRDRMFPPAYLRRVTRERLGLTPVEIDSGHTPALSRPVELADRLEAYARADA